MMDDAVSACLAGRISPEVALARLLLAGLLPDEIGAMLPAGTTIAGLFGAQRGNLEAVARMLAGARVDHETARTPKAIAAMFDHAVACAPEASVAAYALNDPALLSGATAELVDWLLDRGYAHADADVLDLGCGIGRVAAALASHVARVLGTDVSPGMIAEARRRHGRVANLAFAVTDGQPPTLPPACLDLLLAVDSFPYLVQAGVADAHVARACCLLRPLGRLAIFNLAYGEDLEASIGRARRWADAWDLTLEIEGERPFTLWDGAAFVLRRG